MALIVDSNPTRISAFLLRMMTTPMKKLLAIETSGEACSVALAIEGQLHELFEVMPRMHARSLLAMVNDLLANHSIEIADLDAIAYSRGPGSFTGLRIAAGVVQGMAFAAHLPVVPVSTLATLAQGARCRNDGLCLAALDARMDEVYWACYRMQQGFVSLVGEEKISRPEALNPRQYLAGEKNWLGVGQGWHLMARFPEAVRQGAANIIQDQHPHAADVAHLALHYLACDPTVAVTAEQALPVYLRDKTAWKAN